MLFRSGSGSRKMQDQAACSGARLCGEWCSTCWSSPSATQGVVLPADPEWISAMVGMGVDIRSGSGAYGDEIGDGLGCEQAGLATAPLKALVHPLPLNHILVH